MSSTHSVGWVVVALSSLLGGQLLVHLPSPLPPRFPHNEPSSLHGLGVTPAGRWPCSRLFHTPTEYFSLSADTSLDVCLPRLKFSASQTCLLYTAISPEFIIRGAQPPLISVSQSRGLCKFFPFPSDFLGVPPGQIHQPLIQPRGTHCPPALHTSAREYLRRRW